MISRTLAATVALALAAAASAPVRSDRAAPASPCGGCATATTFVFNGRGWGHGVGMSQWGAFGFAQRGASYDRILAHFYPGTELGPGPGATLRVLVAEGRRKLTISSLAAFRVRDGAGQTHELAAGSNTFGPDLGLGLREGAEPKELPGPLRFLPGSAPLELGHRYRGSLLVGVTGGKLQAVNVVGLEAYLYGVVPAEVPSGWPAEALKAQAVAARSYALATRNASAGFDLYADTRSQLYGGIDAENPATSEAVRATRGQIVLYRGGVATTYFFSTSGGRTAAFADIWPSKPPLPYLVSVSDPYDTLSPHHVWGPVGLAAGRVAGRLRVPGLTGLKTILNHSGRVRDVVATGQQGDFEIPATIVRQELDLRSTWFRVGTLSLARPALPVVYGSGVKLTATIRGVEGVVLEQRPAGSGWTEATPVTPGAEGSFVAPVRPLVTTWYRLSASGVGGAVVRLTVAPLVRLSLAPDRSGLQGSLRPVLRGATVEIQRLDDAGGVWETTATATVDEDGSFFASPSPQAGLYRARVAPGHGLVPGTSPELEVASK